MSKEKQIEEMAWDLCDIPMHPSIHSCKECGGKHCHAQYYAERAYNAGYRKQSEVIEEYRQRVNAKMGKHTHLLGKEYVQRILREVAKEMKGGAG